MRAYDTQRWLLYALLTPLALLNAAWCIIQLFIYRECLPLATSAQRCTRADGRHVLTVQSMVEETPSS